MVEACSDLVNECKTLAQQLGTVLLKHQSVVATAESCTGGLIGGFITDISGSSSWFDRGFITYTNKAKMECLGVKAQTLDSFGAVSAETANENSLKLAKPRFQQNHVEPKTQKLFVVHLVEVLFHNYDIYALKLHLPFTPNQCLAASVPPELHFYQFHVLVTLMRSF